MDAQPLDASSALARHSARIRFGSSKETPGSSNPGADMVEVRGIEPLSEDLRRNGSTCVSDSLDFAIAHAHRPA